MCKMSYFTLANNSVTTSPHEVEPLADYVKTMPFSTLMEMSTATLIPFDKWLHSPDPTPTFAFAPVQENHSKPDVMWSSNKQLLLLERASQVLNIGYQPMADCILSRITDGL